MKKSTVAFIGSAGIPNRYGGFEAFLENCAPEFVKKEFDTIVTCDARLYKNKEPIYLGAKRVFLNVPANGAWSIAHDLIAFLKVFRSSKYIVILGVSGGVWFPFFRLMCSATGKKIIVNIDGVEWRRKKFSTTKRLLLRIFDYTAQRFAHHIVFDNEGLRPFVSKNAIEKSTCIAYSGDHAKRNPFVGMRSDHALTICRIEPENNLEMLIEGALLSKIKKYTIVGNWSHSEYSTKLRRQYSNNKRLELLDPIYDPTALTELREQCSIYLHGHSVGGTNPSLVEMLFYDCSILCFDVEFNRHTALDAANYFTDPYSLAALIDKRPSSQLKTRELLRNRYKSTSIADQYVSVLRATASSIPNE